MIRSVISSTVAGPRAVTTTSYEIMWPQKQDQFILSYITSETRYGYDDDIILVQELFDLGTKTLLLITHHDDATKVGVILNRDERSESMNCDKNIDVDVE